MANARQAVVAVSALVALALGGCGLAFGSSANVSDGAAQAVSPQPSPMSIPAATAEAVPLVPSSDELDAASSAGPSLVPEGAGATSCEDYASLDPNTRVNADPNVKQTDLLVQMMVDAGYPTNREDVSSMHVKVIAYCGISAGVAGRNAVKPIADAGQVFD